MGRAAPGEPGWTIGSPGGPALPGLLAPALDAQLGHGEAHETLQALDLRGGQGRPVPELGLGPLPRLLDRVLVDFLLLDGALGQDGNLVVRDLRKPLADTSSSVAPRPWSPAVRRTETWVRSDMWPGRTPISPSTVGITTPSIMSEYTRASGVTISRFRGMGSAHFFVVAMTSSIPPFM